MKEEAGRDKGPGRGRGATAAGRERGGRKSRR